MDEKLSRSDLSLKLQDKVSFEDMKRFMALNGTGGKGVAASSNQSALSNRQLEVVEDEMRILRERTEEIFH